LSNTYRKVLGLILLSSCANFSHALVFNDYLDNNLDKQIESIDEQVNLIREQLASQSTTNLDLESLEQRKESLVAEKLLLENKIASFKKIEAKGQLSCKPPSFLNLNANKLLKRN
jgi:hypothetical protein